MSNDWVTLRKDFHKWLQEEARTDSKLDSEEIEKIGDKKAVLEYSNKFQEFLKTQENSEENFTKNTIDLNDEDNENFLDEIFNDYTSGLKKNSKEFKAIDSNNDGKISSKEKKNFFNSIKDLDKNDKNITFNDFSKAIEKFDDGDYDFVNSSTKKSSTSNASGATQAGGGISGGASGVSGNYSAGEVAETNIADEQLSALTTLSEEKLDQNNYKYTGEEQVNITNITAENIDSQLEIAEQNKTQAQETLDSTNIGLADLGATYTEAYASFNELNKDLANSDANIKTITDNITKTQTELNDGINILTTVLMPAKENTAGLIADNLNELGTYKVELANIESLLMDDSLDDGKKAELKNDKTRYDNLIASTQNTIKELEAELQNNIEAIEKQEEDNASKQADLIDYHLEYESAIEQNETLQQSTAEQLLQMNTLTVNIALLTSVQANAQADVSNADTQVELLKIKKAELESSSQE